MNGRLFGQAASWDLFALQTCAIILGPQHFVAAALDRFQLNNFFALDTADQSVRTPNCPLY